MLGALAVALAAFVKGTLGVGFPILATPVLASLVDPQTTVIAVSVPAVLVNLFETRPAGSARDGQSGPDRPCAR